MIVLERPALQISDCSNVLPFSNSEISTFENNAVTVARGSKETPQLEIRESPSPSKHDRKGKKVLIESSGSVSNQLFLAGSLRKKERASGSSTLLVEPEPSPTLLMGIDEPHSTSDMALDVHQRTVENLETILSDEEEDSEYTGESEDDSDESDQDMVLTDEIEDSTTLSSFQEGIRKEILARKGVSLQRLSQKKGRLGDSDDGDPIRISRPQSPAA